jgi:hypothetical protein
MNEIPNIITERVDDIPLLLEHMQRMELPTLIDTHFPAHGNWYGLSLGWVSARSRLGQNPGFAAKLGWTIAFALDNGARVGSYRAVPAARRYARRGANIAFEMLILPPAIGHV